MNEERGKAPAVDWRAVGVGLLWGIGILVIGAVAQGVVGYGTSMSQPAQTIMKLAWWVAGSAIGGYLAARRADGSGWLHGALSGAALVLSIAAVTGVTTALPTLAALLQMAGLGAGAGAVGGILGVNAGSK